MTAHRHAVAWLAALALLCAQVVGLAHAVAHPHARAVSLLMQHADGCDEQGRAPATDTPTRGATLIDLALAWRQRWRATDALVFARLDNVTDEFAFNAVALRSARELSPLPGRSATIGVRLGR